ncbi:uncharacterized protein LOC114935263 [Nylanderia fulva]|uniref:uncharacterized protein LOC114935263 n=1 Tax=Nylanderia fulva TaxID=613905 RepID=UPI0010FB81B2|nr:uncharacterized protein LOC114935263 [Nylanderia fulva]
MSDFPFLELQIISVNLLSLFVSIWSWFKSAKKQLDKISKFSISDELDFKDIDWLKKVLSWIEVIRIVINLVLPLANIVNICTIATRKWQNLLIFWMVLSLFKDIVLEVVVVVITFLQWHKGTFSTKLLIEFIVDKIMWLPFVSYKWWISLKWYMQLRREAKIRRFAKIANIINVPGRIGHSLDDECLEIATGRRDKYVSLLNLNRRLTERSSNKINFDLRISKSLTTLFTNDDSHNSNDDTNSSSTNDLNVAEKSMKILGLTAEDVMDAYARIQERSYWNEQEVTAETPSGAMEEAVAQFFLEKDGEEISDPLKIDDLQREKNGKKDGKKLKMF